LHDVEVPEDHQEAEVPLGKHSCVPIHQL
jgi:hypothetical protein